VLLDAHLLLFFGYCAKDVLPVSEVGEGLSVEVGVSFYLALGQLVLEFKFLALIKLIWGQKSLGLVSTLTNWSFEIILRETVLK
jgi:hypothetical protein